MSEAKSDGTNGAARSARASGSLAAQRTDRSGRQVHSSPPFSGRPNRRYHEPCGACRMLHRCYGHPLVSVKEITEIILGD